MTTRTTADPGRLFRSVLMLAQVDRPSDLHAASYRFWGRDGEAIYFGSTDRLDGRLNRHLKVSTWVQFAFSGEVLWYPSLGQARIAEIAAIGECDPLFNIEGASPGARRRLVEYLVLNGRLDLLAPAVKLG